MGEKKTSNVFDFMASWWGLVMPIVSFVVSDMGIPKSDDKWWIPWAIAISSFISYVIGRFNGVKHNEMGEIDQLRIELDAVRSLATKHEVEATKWRTMYTTRENTIREMSEKRELL